eukprot:ANDGO_03417.mRNA.1 Ataxin-10 homolog
MDGKGLSIAALRKQSIEELNERITDTGSSSSAISGVRFALCDAVNSAREDECLEGLRFIRDTLACSRPFRVFVSTSFQGEPSVLDVLFLKAVLSDTSSYSARFIGLQCLHNACPSCVESQSSIRRLFISNGTLLLSTIASLDTAGDGEKLKEIVAAILYQCMVTGWYSACFTMSFSLLSFSGKSFRFTESKCVAWIAKCIESQLRMNVVLEDVREALGDDPLMWSRFLFFLEVMTHEEDLDAFVPERFIIDMLAELDGKLRKASESTAVSELGFLDCVHAVSIVGNVADHVPYSKETIEGWFCFCVHILDACVKLGPATAVPQYLANSNNDSNSNHDNENGDGDPQDRAMNVVLHEGFWIWRDGSVDEDVTVFGLRGFAMRLLGICVHRFPSLQSHHLTLGVLPIVLSECRLSKEHPILREWSVFAIRNLCQDNAEIQSFIQNLEFLDLQDSEWLERAGLEVFKDAQDKMRIRKLSI